MEPTHYQHLNPVWRDRANFLIKADVSDAQDGSEFEQLWAVQVTARRFRLACIPVFVYGVALADEVETDDEYVMRGITGFAGYSTFRVWLGDDDAREGDAVAAVLEEQARSLNGTQRTSWE